MQQDQTHLLQYGQKMVVVRYLVGMKIVLGATLNWQLTDGTVLGDLEWFCGNYSYYNLDYSYGSKEVAGKLPNSYGLYDMGGNPLGMEP